MSRQAPRWPRAWSRLHVSGPLHEGWGGDQTASALARLPLKVTAAPGPLLSLCLGASPTEDPAGPSPGPMPKPRPARGLPGGRAKKSPVQGGRGGNPVRTWEAVGHTCRAGMGQGGQSKKAHSPSLQSFPPGTHGLRGGSHRAGHRVGTGGEDVTVARWGWCQPRGCVSCALVGVCVVSSQGARGQGQRAGGLRPGATEGLRLPLPPCPLRGQSTGTSTCSVLSYPGRLPHRWGRRGRTVGREAALSLLGLRRPCA